MSTQNERSIKAQVIWNSTNSNSVTPAMVGSLFYDINVEKLERDNSNAVYQTYDTSYTKVAAINPTSKKMTLIDITDFVEGNLEIKSNKSDSYTSSSSTTYASTKALVDGLATKQNLLTNPITGTGTANYIPKFSATGTIVNSIVYDNGTNVGIGTPAPNSTDRVHVFSSTSKSSLRLQSTHSTSSAEINFQSVGGSGKFELDYNGNIVFRTSQSGLFFDNFSTTGAIYFRTGGANSRMTIDKDGEIFTPSGKIKPQKTITVTGDITLSETHNGAVLNVTNTCNITIPTGLDANFQCVIFAKGSIIVTFVNGGVTVHAPSGLLLKTDKMASLVSTSANNFNLTGELATS